MAANWFVIKVSLPLRPVLAVEVAYRRWGIQRVALRFAARRCIRSIVTDH
jgi:hypothetical protein